MLFFFFNDTATTEIYTLSLHDALPICREGTERPRDAECGGGRAGDGERDVHERARMTGGAADGAHELLVGQGRRPTELEHAAGRGTLGGESERQGDVLDPHGLCRETPVTEYRHQR